MRKKWVAIVVLIIVIVCITASSTLFIAKKLNTEQNSSSTIELTLICSDQLVQRYNKAKEAENSDAYIAELKAVSDEIGKIENSNKDPHCVYMQAYHSIEAGQYDQAQQFVDVLKGLESERKYVTTRIDEPQGSAVLQGFIDAGKAIKTESDDTSRGRG